MIRLYCSCNHGTREGLCPDCGRLNEYARSRSEQCPFMETKTFCVNCSVHCYEEEMRERICEVMRFSGPRMIYAAPLVALRHLIESKWEKRKFN